MPDENALWSTVAEGREGVLATVNGDGGPQLSNVLYVVDPDAGVIRIPTTADRLKAKNLTRDPRPALHVDGSDFWHFAVANGTVEMSAVVTEPGDDATNELFTVHSAFYGTVPRPAFDLDMIANRRLVLRLQVERLHGVLATGGRRPTAEGSEASEDD
jgi:PPOX class probable F420-dependent enzyme